MAQAKDSQLMQSGSAEDRLAEVEDLRAEGLFSGAEYRALRAKALGL